MTARAEGQDARGAGAAADVATTPAPAPAVARRLVVAVLAVQGAFAEHEARLCGLGCTVVELRSAADAQRPFDALVLPGGESTAQAKLLHDLGMFDVLRRRIAAGMPVLGTCAGLVLLARRIQGAGDVAGLDAQAAARRCDVRGFGTLDVAVVRNGYGRQLGSFYAEAPFAGGDPVPLTFIRAPYIARVGEGVEVLAEVDGRVAAVRQGNQLGVAFHPELHADNTVYRLFLSLVAG